MNEDEDEIHLEVRRKPRGVDRPVEVTEHEEEDVVDGDNHTPPITSEVPSLSRLLSQARELSHHMFQLQPPCNSLNDRVLKDHEMKGKRTS